MPLRRELRKDESDDPAELARLERQVLLAARGRRLLRAARAAEMGWIREALGRVRAPTAADPPRIAKPRGAQRN